MSAVDPFKALHQHQQAKRERGRRLGEVAHRWENPIRAGLEHLAQELWPDVQVLGLIPVHRYRLRHRTIPEIQVWWVEHDIPPYDRYWCAAYRVQLFLNEQNEPFLTVQSGSAVHAVFPLSVENLQTILARAVEELPLIISRQMGPAFD